MKKIFAALAAIALSATPSLANINKPGNTLEDHHKLWQTIQQVGVRTRINDRELCIPDANGVYYSQFRLLVICQDNRQRADVEVQWTENDLDTLRHEAHHIVQDCNAGRLGDSMLSELFADPEKYNRFVLSSLGRERAEAIANQYSKDGLNQKGVFIEVEAFAAAAGVDARSIGNKIVEFCGPRGNRGVR